MLREIISEFILCFVNYNSTCKDYQSNKKNPIRAAQRPHWATDILTNYHYSFLKYYKKGHNSSHQKTEMFVIKGSTLQLKGKSLYKGQSNEILLPFQAALLELMWKYGVYNIC